MDRGAGIRARGGEPQATPAGSRVNGHGWWVAVAIGAASFAAGLLWSIHANDATQTQRLDEIARRAEIARATIVDALERLTHLEHEFDLFKQREEVRP
jgi:hypothetical protein